MGEAWTVGTGLTDRLARNRQVDLKRKPDLWSTKVLFTGAENFQGAQRMKETNIYITDALTGELNEVNAYEFFSKKSVVKPHVTFKEKK